jgi:hypothetical protein
MQHYAMLYLSAINGNMLPPDHCDITEPVRGGIAVAHGVLAAASIQSRNSSASGRRLARPVGVSR